MPAGVISDKKIKTTIVLEKDLKSNLETLAKKDMRSLNNLMTTILTEYVEKRKAEL